MTTDTNTAVGVNALGALPAGVDNTALGANALKSANSTAAIQNVAVGSGAGNGITSGYSNVIIGYDSAPTLTTGHSNIVVGEGADVPASPGGSTNSYLNIGGVITGYMSSITGTPSTGAVTLGNGFLATTQTALDNSTKVATTQYVDSAVGAAVAGAMVKLHSGSVDTSSATINVIDMSSGGNYPVAQDTYIQLELRITAIQATTYSANLYLQFMNGGTPVTATNYASGLIANPASITSGTMNSGTVSPEPPGTCILTTPGDVGCTDGSGTMVLNGFCFSSLQVTPNVWMNLFTQSTDTTPTTTYFSMCAGFVACNNIAPGAVFDGLQFLQYNGNIPGPTITFNWALYGIK